MRRAGIAGKDGAMIRFGVTTGDDGTFALTQSINHITCDGNTRSVDEPAFGGAVLCCCCQPPQAFAGPHLQQHCYTR